MEKTIQNYVSHVSLGKRQSYQNLAIFPVLRDGDLSLDYLSLDEALKEKAITITEVSQGGSVPVLKVTNRSQEKLLILDGEELVGAKQNRIINTTILIGPNREIR